MGVFTALMRPAVSGVSVALPPRAQHDVPAAFEGVAEAMATGGDASAACEVVGREMARDGAPPNEVLAGLRATSLAVLGRDPGFLPIQALTQAWSEETLGYLHQLSCEDPMTGLASLSHVRARLSETYRGAERAGEDVTREFALVVVEVSSGGETSDDASANSARGHHHFDRALRFSRVVETVRSVFQGSESLGRTGQRIVVVTRRCTELGRQVGLLSNMLDEASGEPLAFAWIEGLPASEAGAARLLDELARA